MGTIYYGRNLDNLRWFLKDEMGDPVYLVPRLAELRRLAKPTGSLYLHCDPTASHYHKLVRGKVSKKRISIPNRQVCN